MSGLDWISPPIHVRSLGASPYNRQNVCLIPHKAPCIPVKECRWERVPQEEHTWSGLDVLSGRISRAGFGATALLRFPPRRLGRLTHLAFLLSLFTLLPGLSGCLVHTPFLLVGGDFHEAAAVGHVGIGGVSVVLNGLDEVPAVEVTVQMGTEIIEYRSHNRVPTVLI